MVPGSSIARSLYVTAGASLLLFLTGFLIFRREIKKAAAFATVALCSFFSYGLVYDLMEDIYYSGYFPLSHIHRYLMLSYLLLLIAAFLYINKSSRKFINTTNALNTFTYILLLFNLVILISKSSSAHPGNELLADSDTTAYTPPTGSDTLPDIYYIILDGYANDSILDTEFGYSGNSLTKLLEENGFNTATKSRGNYLVTSESLGSSLNYTYLDSAFNIRNAHSIFKNRTCEYLKKKGYRIVHVRSGYSITRENYYADTVLMIQNLNEFERTLLRYTIFRLDDLTGYVHYLTLKEQLSAIRSIPKSRSPKFTFIHIVSPHPPYTCNEKGEYRRARIINTWWETREEYLGQLKFINTQIESFVKNILSNSKIPPIIVLQSDHGPWIKDPSLNKVYEARSLILNSYHIPYAWKSKIYPTITPVNSFPLIFNNLFHDSIPVLPDIPMDSTGLKRYTQARAMMKG